MCWLSPKRAPLWGHWGRWGMLALLGCFMVACSWTGPSADTSSAEQGERILLPGEQIWKAGASSFLFGTNDTQEWASDNVETNPSIQQALKAANMTLMRTFFFDKSLANGHATTDAEIEQRIRTVENSGMTCLGVLFDIMNAAFDTHVVSLLGTRCDLYEFGNEPDVGDGNGHFRYTVQQYLQQWNTLIPQLRRINPVAKFIGPVTYNDTGNDCHYGIDGTHCFMQDFLAGVKASGVIPDAISFHWYPCYHDSKDSCLGKAASYGEVTKEVKGWVNSILGKNLPVGITEWNYDPSVPPPSYGDTFIHQFTVQALTAMVLAQLDFANQFDAQSYGGYGGLDMFDLTQHDQPKAQYYAMKDTIASYLP